MPDKPITISSLDAFAGKYDVILCDVWGVIHNGVNAFTDATAALERARGKGKAVILITNAPRPHGPVEDQLRRLAVPDGAWDRVVTSGDVTRALISQGPRQVFHLGAERDLAIFDGLDVDLVEDFEAASVVCTGLIDDETETPEDYAEILARLRSRDLPMICANPDISVERGDRMVWCAGALARDYGLLGGRTLIAGKPHAPIYKAALRAAGEVLGREVDASQALAVGDGILTDVKGAENAGIDVLYVTAGVHSREYGEPDSPDEALLMEFLNRHGHRPVALINRLR
jgi:HAD superfamily hydrolase (TIGR01459 family)